MPFPPSLHAPSRLILIAAEFYKKTFPHLDILVCTLSDEIRAQCQSSNFSLSPAFLFSTFLFEFPSQVYWFAVHRLTYPSTTDQNVLVVDPFQLVARLKGEDSALTEMIAKISLEVPEKSL